MAKLILAAIGLTAMTVIIHGRGTMSATGRAARLWAKGATFMVDSPRSS